MRIIDVALRVAADGDQLRVRIESPEGRDSAPFELAAGEWRSLFGEPLRLDAPSRGDRLVRPVLRGDSSPTEELGESLHRALFPPEIRHVFERCRGAGDRLRLRLEWDLSDSRIADLQRLPWELLADPATDAPMALDRRITLVRHVDVAEGRVPPPVPRSLRIFPVAASPGDLTPLDLRAELEGLVEIGRDAASLDVLTSHGEAIDLLALRRHLLERGGHVLHFMGHGEVLQDGAGALFFETPGGRSLSVSGEGLAQKLRDLRGLRLVVLNACRTAEIRSRPFAGVATALVRGGIPAVIAMQAPISDRAAIAFSHELYRRLARGEPLDLAICEARHAMHALDPDGFEWAIPVLFLRPGGERLFGEEVFDASGSGGFQAFGASIEGEDLENRYTAWVLDSTREVDILWTPDAGPRPRVDLDSLHALFRPDRSPPTERPRRLEILQKEAIRLADLRRIEEPEADRSPGRFWDEIRRLARGDLEEPSVCPAASADPVDTCEDSSPRDEPAVSLDELLREHRRLVLLGPIGMGKTSLLRWLAHRFAAAVRRRDSRVEVPARAVDPRRDDETPLDLGPARLPILLDAGAYARHRRERPGLRVADYLGRHLGSTLEEVVSEARGLPIDPSALHDFLCRSLARGRALLLVDGLDTIDDPGERLDIVREIEICLEAFLPPDRPTPAEVGGAQVVLVTRSAGYRQAAFTQARHFDFEPMSPAIIERFCRLWARRLGMSEPDDLAEAAAMLYRHGDPDLVGAPLMLSLLAAILLRGSGRIPARRIDLYEPAVALLLERRDEIGRSEKEGALDLRDLRALLADLAAWLHDRSAGFGLVERDWLIRFLSEPRHRSASRVVERLVHRGLGPLVPYGAGLYGFLHFAFQEYLAALWLASDLDEVEARLLDRLGDPFWRVPSAMALGILAERMDRGRFVALLERLLGDRSAKVGTRVETLPHVELLVLEALVELPDKALSISPVASAVRRLSELAAAEASGPVGRRIEEALARWLESSRSAIVARAVADWLDEESAGPQRAERVATVARIAERARAIPPELVDALWARRDLDRSPWPLDRALGRVAVRNPMGLPAPHDSMRRAFLRDPRIASDILRDPAWRRLVLAVHGWAPDDETKPLHRVSALDPWLVEALRAGRGPGSLVDRLADRASSAEPGARDARRALVALGEAARCGESEGREEGLFGLSMPPIDREIDVLLRLIEGSPAERRPPLLAWLWRLALDPVISARYRRHRLAVLLDTHGGLLTESLPAFVDGWILAASSPGVRVPEALDETDRSALVLDALARIPDAFDFVRAWALVVLRPWLGARDFSLEADLFAELTLSSRFAARALARGRSKTGSEPLRVETLRSEASTLADPRRRRRALCRLASEVASLRRELSVDRESTTDRRIPSLEVADDLPLARAVRRLDASGPPTALDLPALSLLVREASGSVEPLPPEEPPLDIAGLDARVERLGSPDDLERWRVARDLHGDRTATTRRWSARRLGLEVVLRAARHWLFLQSEDPRGALVLRWMFQAIEYDSSKLLLDLATELETPGPRAEEAEVALRFLERVEPEAIGALVEILREGSARARKALVEGLPNVLSRRDRGVRAIWEAVSDLLPGAAAVMGDARVDLVGPGAVVEAVERAFAEAGHCDDTVARRARDLHAAARTAWADLLRCDEPERRAHFEALGQRRRVGRRSRAALDVAVERVVAQPPLLSLLIAWTEARLWPDVSRFDLDDHQPADLLAVIAGAGQRLPRTYDESTRSRPGWRRRLCEAVVYSDLLEARRSAVHILGLEPSSGEEELVALVGALGDVPEVGRSVLEVLGRARRIEDLPDVLPTLARELRAPSAARAFAAGRLVAAAARATYCGDSRRRLEALLVEAAADPAARRDVHVTTYDDSPASRSIGLERLGRLDRLLRGLHLDVHGVPGPYLHVREPS